MKLNLYKILFIILLMTLASVKIELSFVFAIAIFPIIVERRVFKPVGRVLLIFLAVFFIGLFGFLRQGNEIGVYIKDIVYFSRDEARGESRIHQNEIKKRIGHKFPLDIINQAYVHE